MMKILKAIKKIKIKLKEILLMFMKNCFLYKINFNLLKYVNFIIIEINKIIF